MADDTELPLINYLNSNELSDTQASPIFGGVDHRRGVFRALGQRPIGRRQLQRIGVVGKRGEAARAETSVLLYMQNPRLSNEIDRGSSGYFRLNSYTDKLFLGSFDEAGHLRTAQRTAARSRRPKTP